MLAEQLDVSQVAISIAATCHGEGSKDRKMSAA